MNSEVHKQLTFFILSYFSEKILSASFLVFPYDDLLYYVFHVIF